jgi:hypothetical protein
MINQTFISDLNLEFVQIPDDLIYQLQQNVDKTSIDHSPFLNHLNLHYSTRLDLDFGDVFVHLEQVKQGPTIFSECPICNNYVEVTVKGDGHYAQVTC